MNSLELANWKCDGVRNLVTSQSVEVDGVYLYLKYGSLCWRYGNSTGLVFPDHTVVGDGEFEPAVRLSPRYSNECRFCILCNPTLPAIAAAVKESWKLFTKGKG